VTSYASPFRSRTPAFEPVPIHPELKKELVAWLAHLEGKDQRRADLPVLVTRNATPMKAQFGWRLIKRVAGRAEVRPLPRNQLSEVTPHTLRRTFGTDLLNRGMPLEHVSKLLGHADTRVTQACYAELLDERFERGRSLPGLLKRPSDEGTAGRRASVVLDVSRFGEIATKARASI
jgi:integrase